MTKHHPILAEIEAYILDTGLSETYFGKKAVNNSELVSRLRSGGSVHFLTESKIREFIKNNPSQETALTAADDEGFSPEKNVGTPVNTFKGAAE